MKININIKSIPEVEKRDFSLHNAKNMQREETQIQIR